MKNIFHFIYKFHFIVSFLRYSNFCISIFPSFFPVSHYFRRCLKKNLKVYDVINCLNKNFNKTFCLISSEGKKIWKWNFVNWWSFKYGTFLWKNHAENKHQKLVPVSFLILINNQNSQCMQELLLKIKYFERGLSKHFKKVNFIFSFESSPI